VVWPIPTTTPAGWPAASKGCGSSVDNDNFNGVVGTFTPAGGASIEVVTPVARDDDSDFFVARAKLNLKFGTY
jgi:hypothetical protein